VNELAERVGRAIEILRGFDSRRLPAISVLIPGQWWPTPAEPASAAQSRGMELGYFDGSTGASSSSDFGACDAA
jgi:hypothetical protein